MKIGLYFGTFNPVHVGHMIIANHFVQYADLEKVWMVVTPHNPLKKKITLLDDYERLHMVRLAIGDNYDIVPSNIEFHLPKPSYTIHTLTYLSEKYPQHEFHLIMGSDNLQTFNKWKNHKQILDNYPIFVYQRPGSLEETSFDNHHNVEILQNVPLMHLSSKFIRRSRQEGKSIQYLVPEAVYKYIEGSNLYKY